jgi:arylsulfatase
MKTRYRFFPVLLSLLAAACNSADPATGTPVVLIVVDTLRADHLGSYGHSRNTSPHIDSLAADAVVYRNAYSTAPWTAPSIASLLASQYPKKLGIRDTQSILSDDLVMLPEVLREAGYATGAVVSHTFCSKKWNFNQGFEEFDESNIVGLRQVSSTGVTREGLDFLDRHKSEPFFLWLHYFDPHFPYLLHDDFPFGTGNLKTWVRSGMSHTVLRKHKISEDDRQEILRIYDSEIGLTDQAIGRVLERLKELGLYERSLIIFAADHGEAFQERGRFGHSGSLHDELVNVPLIIKLPGNRHQEIDTPVSLVDVYPTILALLGLSIDHPIVGQDLKPGQTNPRPRPVFFETARGKKTLQGVAFHQFKLIQSSDLGEFELFDLETDPGEIKNVAADKPVVFAELKSQLEQWIASVEEGPRLSTELSAEELENLAELGYTEDDHGGL